MISAMNPSSRGAGEFAVWIALAALSAVRLLSLGAYPLMDTTEARYAEIARKMAELGDWVTPWFEYGTPYWGKPPLAFWLTAQSLQWFGVNEFAARLPHLLCALAVAWLVWDLGRSRGRRQADLAVCLLAGSSLFFIAAGAVMTDMALTLSLVLIMRGFWLALGAGGRRAGYGVFVGLALGLLAKGPVVTVLALAPLALWTLATRRAIEVWRALPWLRGLAITVSLVAPWYLLAEWRTPGFLEYFLLGEHWQRFVTPAWSGDRYGNAHAEPLGSIWLFAFWGTLPWSLLLPIAALRWHHSRPPPPPADRQWRLYLLMWALTACLFFTMASNIVWTYALPTLPALALWVAGWLAGVSDQCAVRRVVVAGLVTAQLLFLIYLTQLMATGSDEKKSTKALVHHYAMRAADDEPLIFLGKRPYSAAWYSRGRASPARTRDVLEAHFGPHSGFAAIQEARLPELSDSLRQRLQWIALHGDYGLYYVNAVAAQSDGVAAGAQ